MLLWKPIPQFSISPTYECRKELITKQYRGQILIVMLKEILCVGKAFFAEVEN